MSKIIIIMGNGPSMATVRLNRIPEKVHSFGMKNAYKHYEKIGWWPTYYACLDRLSFEQNKNKLEKYIKDPAIKTKMFYLYDQVCISDRVKVIRYQKPLYQFSKDINNLADGGNTATNCAQIAVCLGYEKILLVGIDLTFGIEPEYFITNYREENERRNTPEVGKYHFEAWKEFKKFADKNKVRVVNCGKRSTLDIFPKGSLGLEVER